MNLAHCDREGCERTAKPSDAEKRWPRMGWVEREGTENPTYRELMFCSKNCAALAVAAIAGGVFLPAGRASRLAGADADNRRLSQQLDQLRNAHSITEETLVIVRAERDTVRFRHDRMRRAIEKHRAAWRDFDFEADAELWAVLDPEANVEQLAAEVATTSEPAQTEHDEEVGRLNRHLNAARDELAERKQEFAAELARVRRQRDRLQAQVDIVAPLRRQKNELAEVNDQLTIESLRLAEELRRIRAAVSQHRSILLHHGPDRCDDVGRADLDLWAELRDKALTMKQPAEAAESPTTPRPGAGGEGQATSRITTKGTNHAGPAYPPDVEVTGSLGFGLPGGQQFAELRLSRHDRTGTAAVLLATALQLMGASVDFELPATAE